MSKILLTIKNLKKSYSHIDGSITLFDNFNLQIKEGELVALVGPSGSGKSSLLHIMALLDDPSKGEIKIDKIETKNLSDVQKDKLRRDFISIIFQDNNLLTDFTAIENVLLARLALDEQNKKAFEESKKILKKVGLLNRMDHVPSELSGGESQRIAIARAIINNPQIILADEPTGSLDIKTSKDIFKILFNLKNEKRIIIFATHNRYFANMADCKLHLIDGKIKTINGKFK